MMKASIIFGGLLLTVALASCAPAEKQKANNPNNEPMELNDFTTIKLLPPDTACTVLLMQAALHRQTHRDMTGPNLSLQQLSDILWMANGVNRPDGKRTAPSARNKQNLKVYVNKQDGLWLYDAAAHGLSRVATAPLGSPLNDAPVVLIFAVPEDDPYGDMHVGSVYQNVGLFCASAGLGNVVKASTTRDPARFSFLPQGWKAAATQSVGRPRS